VPDSRGVEVVFLVFRVLDRTTALRLTLLFILFPPRAARAESPTRNFVGFFTLTYFRFLSLAVRVPALTFYRTFFYFWGKNLFLDI